MNLNAKLLTAGQQNFGPASSILKALVRLVSISSPFYSVTITRWNSPNTPPDLCHTGFQISRLSNMSILQSWIVSYWQTMQTTSFQQLPSINGRPAPLTTTNSEAMTEEGNLTRPPQMDSGNFVAIVNIFFFKFVFSSLAISF